MTVSSGVPEQTVAPAGRSFERRYFYYPLVMAAFIILADQLTKLWVRSGIAPGESVPAEGWIRLSHVQNSGAAFGFFSSQTLLLTIVSLLAIVGLVLALRYQPLRTAWASLALGLLLGGSAGNLIDRIRLGYVTDFIDVGLIGGWRFYTFNIADSAITVGSILMAIILIFGGPMKPAGRSHSDNTSDGGG